MAGESIKVAASLWASSDSTSGRNEGSPVLAFSRKADRWLSSRSSAAWYRRSISPKRSGSIGSLPAQLSCQPSSCELPVPHHRIGRNLQHLGGLFYTQAAKKAQLHHLSFPGVELSQTLQSIVQRHEVSRGLCGHAQSIVERYRNGLPAPLLILSGAGKIDKNASHGPGADGKEMCPVLPVHP